MKRVILLILCLLLVSCEKAEEDYFLQPRILQITFEQDGVTLDGRLETSSEEIRFYPDEPEGVVIRIDSGGGEISYSDIVFEDVTEEARLKAFWDQLTEGALRLTFSKKPYPDIIEGSNFKITVHKELDQ